MSVKCASGFEVEFERRWDTCITTLHFRCCHFPHLSFSTVFALCNSEHYEMKKSGSLKVERCRIPTGRVANEEREKSNVSKKCDGGEEDKKVQPGKKIVTPESIQRRIDDLGKPPPACTKELFVGLGLSGLGSNPHCLRAGKDVSREDLKALLGEPTNRHQYKYDNCEDYDVRNWIESTWPQIYSKF